MDYNKSTAPPMGSNTGYSTGQSSVPPYQAQNYPYPEPTRCPPAYSPQQQVFGDAPHYTGVRYEQQPYFMGQQYVGQPRVITVQSSTFGTPASPQIPINDYLGYSIFTTLFCCLPLGIGALVHSCSAREAIQTGDRAAAARFSRTALTLNNVALGLGITAFTTALVLLIVILVI